jgi:PAS domain S-box-containing protein
LNNTLSDLVDMVQVNKLAKSHYKAAGMPIGIIDAMSGVILVSVGWQDICARFHRAHAGSAKRCDESDRYIKNHIRDGEPCAYKCQNGLWDIGVPILVEGEHLATLFLGQFLYEGESPDRDFFIRQAQQFGYDLSAYLAALDRIPTFSRQKVENILDYNVAFADFIADMAGKKRLLNRELDERKRAEEALKQRERKFRAIFDQTFQFAWLLSTEGRIMETNRSALQLIGVHGAEIIGKPFWETPWCTHSTELQEKLREAIKKTSTGQTVRFEINYPWTDGSLHYVDFSLKPVEDESGGIAFLMADARDINERKRAEEALRQSDEHFRLSFDQSPIGAVLTSLDYRLKRVNEAYCRMLGYSEKELLSLRFTDLTHPDDVEANVALHRRLTAGDIDHYRLEKRYIRKDGSIIWVSVSARTVRGAKRDPIHFMVLVEDITARKRMEQALRDSEKDLNRAQFVAKTGSWRLDVLTNELIWSDETYRIFGVQKGTPLTYEMFLARVHPEDRDYVDGQWKAALLGEKYDIEHRIVVGDRVVWARERAELEFDGKGTLLGGFGTVQDITGRKRMEEELRKARDELELRVKERTAELEKANMQMRQIPSRLIAAQEEERKRLASELHDSIGQTLAAMKFWVEMALKDRDEGCWSAAFKHLEQFVPILQRSIEETRSIYMGLRPSMLDSMGLIASIEYFRRECMRLYPDRHIELETGVIEEEIPENLKVCIFRIAQEALNNIAKHSRAEWVDISLSKVADGIELVVSDDGVGMDPEFILQTSTARSLGLTGMRERAELTGGSFAIKSTPGEGTTIRTWWPIESVNLQTGNVVQ